MERLQRPQQALVRGGTALAGLKQAPLDHGDVLRAFSAVDAALPTQRQSKRVRVEGEVLRPGPTTCCPQGQL